MMRHVPVLSRKRVKEKREQRIQLIIFCEDANAAPDYFRIMKRKYQSAIVEIQEIIGAAGEPKRLTDSALKRRKEINQRKRDDKSVEYDQVWAVFDRDEHIWFDESIQRCEDGDVNVAYANPCFELWILLHQEACHNSADDRHQLQKKCITFLPGYDPRRSKTGNFDQICSNVEIAERNADWLTVERTKEGDPRGRPSTSVQLLTRVIRGATKNVASGVTPTST